VGQGRTIVGVDVGLVVGAVVGRGVGAVVGMGVACNTRQDGRRSLNG
jgi:hypothetical protein